MNNHPIAMINPNCIGSVVLSAQLLSTDVIWWIRKCCISHPFFTFRFATVTLPIFVTISTVNVSMLLLLLIYTTGRLCMYPDMRTLKCLSFHKTWSWLCGCEGRSCWTVVCLFCVRKPEKLEWQLGKTWLIGEALKYPKCNWVMKWPGVTQAVNQQLD